jgi:RNA polymerase sigma-70 factor (ECF subfamily)
MNEATLKSFDRSALRDAIRLVHKGDKEAFALIYRNYSDFVYRICLRMLRDPSEAEDAAQDTFVRVFLKINTFRGESAFSSWLYRLTTNVILMRFRQNKRYWAPLGERIRGNLDPGCEIDAPDLHTGDPVGRLDLQAAIDLLPDGCKAAFILHAVHGYEHKEIGALLGCSVGNSKSQLHRARKRLRKLLANLPGETHLRARQKVACAN